MVCYYCISRAARLPRFGRRDGMLLGTRRRIIASVVEAAGLISVRMLSRLASEGGGGGILQAEHDVCR